MTHFVRQSVGCTLLAVFGGLSLMGQALHMLLPHGCNDATCNAGTSHKEAASSCGCSHHHHHDGPSEDQSSEPVSCLQLSTKAEHPHDCTICRFLSLRVQIAIVAPLRMELPDSPATVLQSRAQRKLPCLEPYSARGPPAAIL